MQRRIKLLIAYDGTDYIGWQENGMGPSIEGTLQRALVKVLRESPELVAASRTDAGVHASGQVVAFGTSSPIPIDKLLFAVNTCLPKAIRLLSAEEVDPDFHPTLGNRGKLYSYAITLGPMQLPHKRLYAWHLPGHFACDPVREAIPALLGSHDFATFCNEKRSAAQRGTICTLRRLELTQNGHELTFEVEGDRFLYRMVRNLVGTLVAIGRGRAKAHDLRGVLERCDRRLAGPCAPAHGLTLSRVFFDP